MAAATIKLTIDLPQEISLTEREIEVLKLMAEGKSNTKIANHLIISPHTAKAHVGHILEKFHVHDRVQAVVLAIKLGIIK